MSWSQKKNLHGWIFMLPWMIGFIMFFAVPLKNTILYSFHQVNVGAKGGIELTFHGIGNYISLFVSEVTTLSQPIQRLFVSENVSIITNLPLIVVFSLFLAIIANANFPGRGIVRVIFFLPIVLGLSLIVEWAGNSTGKQLIESATGGMFGAGMSANLLFEYTFLPEEVVTFLSGVLSNIFSLFTKTGVQTMIFLAGLQSISPAHYEVAKLEGANSYEIFWKVTLPLLSNVFVFATIYTLIDLFLNSSIAEEVYAFAFVKSKIGIGSALSVVYIINVLLVLLLVLFILKAVNFIEKK